MKGITLNGLLKEIADEADSMNKTASGSPSGNSVLLGMTEDEVMKVAESIESQGQVNAAADRIVSMRKEAAQKGPKSGPSAVQIYLEMRKVAYQQAAEDLGLISKTSDDKFITLSEYVFSADNPLQKLAEVAAYYYADRLLAGASKGGQNG